jgi:hypothetical protein
MENNRDIAHGSSLPTTVNNQTPKTEKVSPIFEIPAHHCDLVFQSNEGMTFVLIKPSQLGGLKFLRN